MQGYFSHVAVESDFVLFYLSWSMTSIYVPPLIALEEMMNHLPNLLTVLRLKMLPESKGKHFPAVRYGDDEAVVMA